MSIDGSTTTNAEYGADQIQILEGLEAVRKRPGMLHRQALPPGACITWSMRSWTIPWTRLWPASVRISRCPLTRTISVTVIDDGRGIPVGINHKAGLAGGRSCIYHPSRRGKVRRRGIQGFRRAPRKWELP